MNMRLVEYHIYSNRMQANINEAAIVARSGMYESFCTPAQLKLKLMGEEVQGPGQSPLHSPLLLKCECLAEHS